jgi:hypothetical protein
MNSHTDACGSFDSGSPLSHKTPTTDAVTTSKKASHPNQSMNQKFSRHSGCMASSLRCLRIASL